LIPNYFHCIYLAFLNTQTQTHNSFVLPSVTNGRSPAAAHEKREVHTLKLGVSQMLQALHGIAHLQSYFLFCFKVKKIEPVLSSNEAMKRIVESRTAAVKVTRKMQTV
jgi:Ca2+/H+ antiporter